MLLYVIKKYVYKFMCTHTHTLGEISDSESLTHFLGPGSLWHPAKGFQLLLRIMFLNELNKIHRITKRSNDIKI